MKKSVQRGIFFAFFIVSLGLVTAAEIELEVRPRQIEGVHKPRNSEVNFIELNDGRIVFNGTKFTGGSRDHDRGITWSKE